MKITRLAGWVFVASFLLFVVAAMLYFTRDMEVAGSRRIIVERGLIILVVVLTAIGFFLVSFSLRASEGGPWLWLGALVYLFGGVVIVAAEVIGVTNGAYFGLPISRLQMAYVLLAFLGQAAIGFGLTKSTAVSASIGWLTVIWNLGFFVIALLSRDVYFPWRHHLMPLVIGMSLLLSPKQRKR